MSDPSSPGPAPRAPACATTPWSPRAYWADTVTDGATRMLVLFYFYQLGYTPLRGGIAVHLLRSLRHHHQPLRRLRRRPLRAQDDALHRPRHPARRAVDARLRAAGLAGRRLGHGLAGAERDRQGHDQDEFEERGQADRARGFVGNALPLGVDPDRLEERAQGRRLLPRRPAADPARLPDRAQAARRAGRHHPRPRQRC